MYHDYRNANYWVFSICFFGSGIVSADFGRLAVVKSFEMQGEVVM